MPRGLLSNRGAVWLLIPTILRRSLRPSANSARSLSDWRKWGVAREKRRPNMLELMSLSGSLPS